MIHTSVLPRSVVLVATLFVALLVSVLPATSVSAQAPDAAGERTVRLVERPDGSLEVRTGASFAATDGVVLVEEADSVLYPAGGLSDNVFNAAGTVTDEFRTEQWNLDTVEAERVWQQVTGEGQVIAIVDTGIDGDHPDLEDRLVQGWSATDRDELEDRQGHGTHVAGTAAASVGEAFGIAGMAPQAQLMSVQVTDTDGSAFASNVSAGLIWAADHGATVANISLAGTTESQVLNRAIDYAIDKGVVVIVAAGNEYNGDNPQMYPASHPDVIAVGALRDPDTRSAFSSTGAFLDLSAPGSAIMSTRPRDAFGYASGTSMASPLVAGATALLLSADSSLSVGEVHSLLTESARDLGDRGRDDEFGHGALDIVAALTALGTDFESEPDPDPEPEPEPTPESGPAVWRDTPSTHFSRG